MVESIKREKLEVDNENPTPGLFAVPGNVEMDVRAALTYRKANNIPIDELMTIDEVSQFIRS